MPAPVLAWTRSHDLELVDWIAAKAANLSVVRYPNERKHLVLSKDGARRALRPLERTPGSATVVTGLDSYRLLIRSSQMAQNTVQPRQLGIG